MPGRLTAWYEDAKENARSLHSYIQNMYYAAKGERLDAGETAEISRALTYVVKRTFDKRFPELKARLFFPVNYEVPEGAEAWSERGYTWAGMAKIIHDYAKDLPVVSALATETLHKPKIIGDAYFYSIIDLARSAFSGISLDTKLAFAAKRAQEMALDQIAAVGEAETDLSGALNSANVPLLTAAGGDIIGNWPNATSDQTYQDLMTMANKMAENTLGTFTPDSILFDLVTYNLIMSKPFSDLDPRSVGRVFLENNAFIRNIDWWIPLNLANAAGNGPRALVYKRDAEIIELFVMKEFTQLPPIQKALSFLINCYSVVGGVSVHYPLGLLYVDGIR
jgi:hypothetical protein